MSIRWLCAIASIAATFPISSSARMNPLRSLTIQPLPRALVVLSYNGADAAAVADMQAIRDGLGLAVSKPECQDGEDGEAGDSDSQIDCQDSFCANEPVCKASLFVLYRSHGNPSPINTVDPAPYNGLPICADSYDHEIILCSKAKWATDCADPCCVTDPLCTKAASQITDAHAYFTNWAAGTVPVGLPADLAAGCRGKYVVLVSDGYLDPADPYNVGGTSQIAAENAAAAALAAGIKTYVIATPNIVGGLATVNSRLDPIAVKGGTGTARWDPNLQVVLGKIKTAALTEILVDANTGIEGDYTTAQPGVATTASKTGIEGNVSLVASVKYPEWEGHLRATDLADELGPKLLWDAGAQVTAQTWDSRKLYTGFPDTNKGQAVPLIAGGVPCLVGDENAGCAGKGMGVNAAWCRKADGKQQTDCTLCTPACPANRGDVVKWIAGFGRSWKLPPIINSTPATVGPAMANGLSAHAAHVSATSSRQKLIYVTSNEGLIHAFDVDTGNEVFAYMPPNLLERAAALYAQAIGTNKLLQNGQKLEPNLHYWVLANSPRVEDVYDGKAWKTILVQTMGPSDEHFVVLDINDPSVTPPLNVIYHTELEDLTTLDNYYGETWSIPSLSYRDATGAARASMGSGYRRTKADEETYYTLWDENLSSTSWDYSKFQFYQIASASPKVSPYAVIADTATMVDTSAVTVATYQGTLNGTILRFVAGGTTVWEMLGASTTWMTAGTSHPFHLGPAVLRRGTGTDALVAAVSGAFQEEDPFVNSMTSTMFLMRENAVPSQAVPATDLLKVAITALCTDVTTGAGSTYKGNVAACTWTPTTRSLPTARPMLLDNQKTGEAEAMFLFYERPASQCSGSKIAVGNSYLVRISSSSTGDVQTLLGVKSFSGTIATGMTVLGAGSEVVVSQSGKGSTAASVGQLVGKTLSGESVLKPPVIESWREVR